MANICTFEGYAKGPKKDLERFKKAFETCYDYTLTKEAKLKLQSITKQEYFNDLDLEKLLSNPKYEQKVKEILKDPQSYLNYPENPHFYRIFGIQFFNEKDNYVEFFGNCAWSVLSTMTKEGYYNNDQASFRKGTCLEDFTSLTFEIISTEPGMQFSEYAIMHDGEFSIDCEELIEHWTDSYEEAQEIVPFEISEETWLATDTFYDSKAPWLQVSDDHAFYDPIYQYQD